MVYKLHSTPSDLSHIADDRSIKQTPIEANVRPRKQFDFAAQAYLKESGMVTTYGTRKGDNQDCCAYSDRQTSA